MDEVCLASYGGCSPRRRRVADFELLGSTGLKAARARSQRDQDLKDVLAKHVAQKILENGDVSIFLSPLSLFVFLLYFYRYPARFDVRFGFATSK